MNVHVNGIDVEYTIEGEGPWLTLSHSLACDLSMWDEQVAAWRDRYKILRYDTRGHGRTSAPQGPYSLDMLADDLKGLLDKLDVRSTHYVGLSMGGMIGQTFALKYPGIFKTLVLADTTSRYAPEALALWEGRIRTVLAEGMEPLVTPTLERWFTAPYRAQQPEVMKRVTDMIRRTPVAGYVGCCQALPQIDLTARLHEIATPTLIVVGDQDAGTPVAMSQEIHAAKPGSELVILPSASHLSNIEQPAAFTKAVGTFLGKHA